nr:6093_t:CDS:2 [Entrophospora candida]
MFVGMLESQLRFWYVVQNEMFRKKTPDRQKHRIVPRGTADFIVTGKLAKDIASGPEVIIAFVTALDSSSEGVVGCAAFIENTTKIFDFDKHKC